jgi:hypothetical protein
MTSTTTAHLPAETVAGLDNLTLARKEGWLRMVQAPGRIQPQRLSKRALAALDQATLDGYNRSRRFWHANLGPLKTPQLAELHEDLWDILDSNLQDGDKAKGAVAVDAFPGMGKTTAVLAFAKQFHLREIAEAGERTAQGHQRLPVCRVGLSGNTGMKDFNRAMLEFFGHPGHASGTTTQFANRALDCVISCESRLLIVDDLHFLRWRHRSAVEISNHFKYIANEFPVTLLFIGVGLAKRGLFHEMDLNGSTVLAQTGRRTTALGMEPFRITEEHQRRDWHNTLLGIERRLVLARAHRGMLAEDLSDYLFARTSGHIGSLMTLVNRGCQRAIRTSEERLTRDLLDNVKIDAVAEKGRRELEAALGSHRLTSNPSPRSSTATPTAAR